MKTVLITGGASGLGEALAWHYAKQNFEVCIVDLNSQRGHKVVDNITQSGAAAFFLPCDITDEAAVSSIAVPGYSSGEESEDDPESDPLYDEAVAFVLESRKASISSVQRKLRVGYNRAARLIEQMEVAGVVSPMSSNGSRDILSQSGG